jgi:hypothetical protein
MNTVGQGLSTGVNSILDYFKKSNDKSALPDIRSRSGDTGPGIDENPIFTAPPIDEAGNEISDLGYFGPNFEDLP